VSYVPSSNARVEGDFKLFWAKQRCANFLWEQQSYENTDAYAPPLFWVTYSVYIFYITRSQNAWLADVVSFFEQPPAFTGLFNFSEQGKVSLHILNNCQLRIFKTMLEKTALGEGYCM